MRSKEEDAGRQVEAGGGILSAAAGPPAQRRKRRGRPTGFDCLTGAMAMGGCPHWRKTWRASRQAPGGTFTFWACTSSSLGTCCVTAGSSAGTLSSGQALGDVLRYPTQGRCTLIEWSSSSASASAAGLRALAAGLELDSAPEACLRAMLHVIPMTLTRGALVLCFLAWRPTGCTLEIPLVAVVVVSVLYQLADLGMHRSTQVLAGATVPGSAVERLVLAWLGSRVGATSTARQGATPGRKQATSNQQPGWTTDGTRRGKRRGGRRCGIGRASTARTSGRRRAVPLRISASHMLLPRLFLCDSR